MHKKSRTVQEVVSMPAGYSGRCGRLPLEALPRIDWTMWKRRRKELATKRNFQSITGSRGERLGEQLKMRAFAAKPSGIMVNTVLFRVNDWNRVRHATSVFPL
mmetsp:Transcript_65164/g.103218  ORF Transcript_65164/g.103218 Transcript_65164/m.103218 type:complete len:103 (-) Transcript_65164:25-333(-)